MRRIDAKTGTSDDDLQALGYLLDLAYRQINTIAANSGLVAAENTHKLSGFVVLWKHKIESSEEVKKKKNSND